MRTGYNAIADEWIGIRPGTDGLFVGALIHELLRTENIDLDYLVRYTNAPWLVIDDPARRRRRPVRARRRRQAAGLRQAPSGALADATRTDIAPALVGTFKLPDGRTARPAFALIARALPRRRIRARTRRRRDRRCRPRPSGASRRELAQAAFEQTSRSTCRGPTGPAAGTTRPSAARCRCTPCAASRPIRTASRPAACCTCCRSCSARSIAPAASATRRRSRGRRRRANRPARPSVKPGTPLTGAPLGFPHGPEDLLVDADGQPQRIDKAYSWDAPIAAHGLMHMVITNAAMGDPYPVDVLFMYMANMSWNSSMNIRRVLEAPDRNDPATGEYKIPKIIYSDAYSSEMVAYADLILPDTTYLERWDCISLLDRPISDADGPADAIRQPVVEPDRDVRGFQNVLIDLGARLKLPGFTNDDGAPRYPGGYPDYIVNHERAPGHRPAGRLSRRGRQQLRRAARPIRSSSTPTSRTAASTSTISRRSSATSSTPTRPISTGPRQWASSAQPQPDRVPALSRAAAEIPAGRARPRRDQPPESHRARIESYFDPIPFWYPPFEGARRPRVSRSRRSRSGRCTCIIRGARRMRWLRQITAETASTCTATRAQQLGIADDDWVWITSAHRPRQGPRPADGGRQPRHGVDLERDRQARRRGGARSPTRRRRRAASCSTT